MVAVVDENPVIPTQRRVGDDNRVLNEIKRLFYDSSDAFGRQVAEATANELDIASQYTFNPERLRLFKNDNRQFVQYNTISTFDDKVDVWTMQPTGGDTMHIESAESTTYTVNYEMQTSYAFQLNQSLSDGDIVRVGPRNGSDGWQLEQRGADHTDTQFDVIELAGGSTTTLASDVELAKPLTDWTRLEARYNWYGVGNQRWSQTYTDNGEQRNEELVTTSRDGTRGPETGNLNLWYEIVADSGTSGLELDVGSMGAITLGAPVALTRSKPVLVETTVSGTNDAWEPIYALRLDPNDGAVNAQFKTLDVLNYTNNATIELVMTSVSPSKTDIADGDWGEPEYHHATDTALQSTTSVSQVPNTSGTQTDLGTSEKFGGFTLASAVDIDGGNSSGSSAAVSDARQEKKAILASDHIVFLARTGNTGGTISFVWDISQNW